MQFLSTTSRREPYGGGAEREQVVNRKEGTFSLPKVALLSPTPHTVAKGCVEQTKEPSMIQTPGRRPQRHNDSTAIKPLPS